MEEITPNITEWKVEIISEGTAWCGAFSAKYYSREVQFGKFTAPCLPQMNPAPCGVMIELPLLNGRIRVMFGTKTSLALLLC